MGRKQGILETSKFSIRKRYALNDDDMGRGAWYLRVRAVASACSCAGGGNRGSAAASEPPDGPPPNQGQSWQGLHRGPRSPTPRQNAGGRGSAAAETRCFAADRSAAAAVRRRASAAVRSRKTVRRGSPRQSAAVRGRTRDAPQLSFQCCPASLPSTCG